MLPAASSNRIASDSPLAESVVLGIRAMQTAVNANQTISSALQDLRARRIESSVIYIYAIEDDERLVGEVSTRELLFAPPETIIRDVMRTTFVTINMDVSMNDALDVFHKNKLMALPVVDHEGRLMGILNIEQYARESLARAEKQRVRQVFQTLGLDVADAEHMTVMESFSMRMPWLVCNIGGGILCAMIVRHDCEPLRALAAASCVAGVVPAIGADAE